MKTSYKSDFTYKDIFHLTDRDLLKLLKQVENFTLLSACYGDKDLIGRIASVFSEKGQACFYEDLGDMGSVSSGDQAAARQEIEEIFNEFYLSGEFQDWIDKSKYAS